MKQAVNSYAAKSVISVDLGRETLSRAGSIVGAIPSFGWLMMIMIAITGLSLTTYMRSRAELSQARSSIVDSNKKIADARILNAGIGREAAELRSNPKAGKLAAKERLRLVARDEVVVAVK